MGFYNKLGPLIEGQFVNLAKTLRASRTIKEANCLLQWYAWLTVWKTIIDKLESGNFDLDAFVLALGVKAILGSNPKKLVDDSLLTIEEDMAKVREFERRLNAPPSGWDGVHKPPYHSIAIHEVVYQFSNITGYGSMIIIFNPEGFGFKPRPPQIIKYVSEDEIAEFLSSKSWGEYWRTHYLLRTKRRKRRTVRTADIITGEENIIPEAEDLDDYIERVLKLPEYADDIIADEFQDLINYAFDKNEDLSTQFIKALEKGSIGRGVEERGLRVTNALNEYGRAIPKNLQSVITKNPILKDIGSFLPGYKKAQTRMRELRGAYNSAGRWGSLNAEAIAFSQNFGTLSLITGEIAMGTSFGTSVAGEVSLGLSRVGAEISYASETARILAANEVLLQGKVDSIISMAEAIAPDIDINGVKLISFAELEKYPELEKFTNRLKEEYLASIQAGDFAPPGVRPEGLLNFLDTNLRETILGDIEKRKLVARFERDRAIVSAPAQAAKNIFLPPECIPIIR